jgi:repressor of nif and glnA expression
VILLEDGVAQVPEAGHVVVIEHEEPPELAEYEKSHAKLVTVFPTTTKVN